MADNDFIYKDALVSGDGKYRYWLTRTWSSGENILVWLMMNPSVADHHTDDSTVIRIQNFTREWGYDGLEVVNLFGFRATDPKHLHRAAKRGFDIVGPRTNELLATTCRDKDVMVAWGNNASPYPERVKAVFHALVELDSNIYHMGVTMQKQPKHPLMLKGDTKRIPLMSKSGVRA